MAWGNGKYDFCFNWVGRTSCIPRRPELEPTSGHSGSRWGLSGLRLRFVSPNSQWLGATRRLCHVLQGFARCRPKETFLLLKTRGNALVLETCHHFVFTVESCARAHPVVWQWKTMPHLNYSSASQRTSLIKPQTFNLQIK